MWRMCPIGGYQMPKNKDGAELFDAYYEGVYKNRWQCLKSAMMQQRRYAGIYKQPVDNPWLFPWLTQYPNEPEDAYFLDPASVWAASQLPLENGDLVLDMSAAPGGKSLVTAKRMGPDSQLICNDQNPKRLHRLKTVMTGFAGHAQWSAYCKHGAWYGMNQPNHYDAVLLDAPCSSERHWITDPKWLSKWRGGRSRSLAVLQGSLLASALDAVKPYGHVLYMTCSISPKENDELVERLLKKRRFCVKPVDNFHETTLHGVCILPDKPHASDGSTGWGPLYLSLLQKMP